MEEGESVGMVEEVGDVEEGESVGMVEEVGDVEVGESVVMVEEVGDVVSVNKSAIFLCIRRYCTYII